jgi:DNA-directed RNA polymerase specialized sigma54-like protein
MKQRHAWIPAALTLLLQSTASAQQTTSDSPQPTSEKPAQSAADPQQDAGAHGSLAEHDAENRARTSRHLYGIQVDGVRLSALDKSQVKQLQQALQDQGYYTSAVDGVAGPKTRLALRQYYLDQAELALQDLILPQGASSLGLDEADIERVRGEESDDPRARDDGGEIERTRGMDSTATEPEPAPKR